MTANTAPAKSRGNLVADMIAGITTGVANILATTTLGVSTRAAYEAAQRWLQESESPSIQ